VKQHRFDVLSFVAGVVFVGFGVAFLTCGSDVAGQAEWLWPAVLLVLGAAGLASALGGERCREPRSEVSGPEVSGPEDYN
jgi:hypothetical protein